MCYAFFVFKFANTTMNKRFSFYKKTLNDFVKDKNATILVCGGGILDKTVLEKSNFKNVTISNLDKRIEKEKFSPFKWSFQNAESLTFGKNAFDYVITHAAIHHSSSPHRYITEMFRVAKKGILVIESRDSILMQILEKFKICQTYEHRAVFGHKGKFGGVNNTHIPNYIYRWTEREIEKTITSYSPALINKFSYRYGNAFASIDELNKPSKLLFFLIKLMMPLYHCFVFFFPKQQNLFAVLVEKGQSPDNLQPWLIEQNNKIEFNLKWKKY